ncbi:MAG: zinc ribbon domain-containing protein [Chloroflexi bacterium]|nr:zinc ribbon domain-containing protein [Chloroflexota bacterium]
MPVYVYHCANCNYEFEQQQSFSDKPLKICPECGQVTLHKVFTPVSVIYKGSGFYSTDHRSSSGSSSSSPVKKEDSKTESPKPEKKTETETTKTSSTKASD